MAEANTPQPPRPIGIKPISIKPMQTEKKPDAAPPPEPAAQSESPATPGGIKPISIPSNTGAGKPLGTATAPTIRLKPVVQSTAEASGGVAPTQTMRPPTIQPPSIKPSTHPPMSAAAKAKTSRISLDAAFGDTSGAPTLTPGASAAAPLGKITSHLTVDGETPQKSQTSRVNLPLASSESEVTRRRTLRVKVPGKRVEDDAADSATLTEAPTLRKKKALVLKKDSTDTAGGSEAGDQEEAHVSAFSAFQNQPVEKTNPIFPVLAVASILMIITLTVLYMSQACGQDRSMTAFSSFPSISAPSWPGRVNAF